MILSKYLRVNSHVLILAVLIPYFLFVTGALPEASRIHSSYLLSQEIPACRYELVHDEETQSAEWLKEHVEEDSLIYTADIHGRNRLTSQGKISPRLTDGRSFFARQEIPGYVYLSYNNVVNDKLVVEHEFYDMSEYLDEFTGKKRIYNNGGSQVYK